MNRQFVAGGRAKGGSGRSLPAGAARRGGAALLLLPLLLASGTGAVPVRDSAVLAVYGLVPPPPPPVEAVSWILYDDTFGRVLAEQEADEQRAVASTTKIMTALVVLERVPIGEMVDISERAAGVGESEIGLVAGEPPWTVGDLLAAMMLQSANDAAVALAEHVGGSVAGFADLMNAKVDELGLENSRFANPHGLDQRDHYSTSRDLLTLTLEAMDNPEFARLVQTRSANLPAAPDGAPRVAVNRNDLLVRYPAAIGVKTGYTERAVLTMVAAAERDRRRLYAVVLGTTEHYDDAAALLEYGFTGFLPMTLAPATSGLRRPLAAGLEPARDEDFDLFITDSPGIETEMVEEEPDPEVPGTPAEPAPEAPVTVTIREVERYPDLPGAADALTWVARYWEWLAGEG